MSRQKILVVDDSRLICQVVSDAFSAENFEVYIAEDGVAALACLRDERPDLIIADILMPRMDGWALCEEVRRDPATREIPFIFLTTERDVPKRIKGLEMGADDYVVKPFAKEELVARAVRLLRRTSPAPPPAGEPTEPGALAGYTGYLPMADLLQALSLNGCSGTLNISGVSVGRIYFDHGRILNAEAQGLTGEKALFRVVAWPEARFSFEPGKVPSRVAPVISGSTSSVLMEGFAHLDELKDLIAALPPGDQHLKIAPEHRLALENLQLSTMQRLILFTAGDRGDSVDHIVNTVPETDLAVYAAVQDLLSRGLLVPVPSR
ncbi:MAG: response regulator [Candidatus Polarisedimenticolia bacterium]